MLLMMLQKLKYKKKSSAFTLIEVLIAMSISIFIILGMTQLYRNVMRFLSSSREIMNVNKKICLTFNQLENDISSAFIPDLAKEEKAEKSENGTKEKAVQVQVRNKKTKDTKFFWGEIYEDEYRRIDGKKFELFKSLNFICTNPLEVYGERRSKIVRVKYELVRDKNKNVEDKVSYTLFRSETYELNNTDFKETEDLRTQVKQNIIRKYVIAERIKDFFVEYVSVKPTKEKEIESRFAVQDEDHEIRSFVWNTDLIKKYFSEKKEDKQKNIQKDESKKSEEPEIKYLVPQYIEVKITFWNEVFKKEFSFSNLIPIFSYPTKYVSNKDVKKDFSKEDDTKSKQNEDKKNESTSPKQTGAAPVLKNSMKGGRL